VTRIDLDRRRLRRHRPGPRPWAEVEQPTLGQFGALGGCAHAVVSEVDAHQAGGPVERMAGPRVLDRAQRPVGAIKKFSEEPLDREVGVPRSGPMTPRRGWRGRGALGESVPRTSLPAAHHLMRSRKGSSCDAIAASISPAPAEDPPLVACEGLRALQRGDLQR
jgi:hypothetical protein